MLGNYFYHQIVRKTVIAFGTLFNDIHIRHDDGAGNVISDIKVPIAYGPRQKFLARITQQAELNKATQITLPRMSFEITNISYDSTRKAGITQTFKAKDVNNDQMKKVFMPVPYNLGFDLNILVKLQDDGLQILEQILPYFQPEYTVSIKPIDGWTNYKQDVPIILTGVNIDDQYDGDYMSRRALVYSLDFTMKMTFYSGTSDSKVIKTINIDFNNDVGGSEILENMDITINPANADEDDNYTVNVTIT